MAESKRKEKFVRNIELCKQYIDEQGKLVLPRQNPETRRLANWLNRQNNRNNVPSDEETMLNDIRKHRDMRRKQEKHEESWNDFFIQIKQYKEDYHTLVISKKDKEHKPLYDWSFRQRRLEKEGSLKPERRDALASIGFRFSKPRYMVVGKERFTKEQNKLWETRFEELVQFKSTYGHCAVLIDDAQHGRLAKWVHQQRVTYTRGQMDDERLKRLSDIGFQWKIR